MKKKNEKEGERREVRERETWRKKELKREDDNNSIFCI